VHKPQRTPTDVHRRQARRCCCRCRPSKLAAGRRAPRGVLDDHKGAAVVDLGEPATDDGVVAQLEQQALADERVEQRQQRVAAARSGAAAPPPPTLLLRLLAVGVGAAAGTGQRWLVRRVTSLLVEVLVVVGLLLLLLMLALLHREALSRRERGVRGWRRSSSLFLKNASDLGFFVSTRGSERFECV
jgi:hypothetical protein